MWLIDFTRVGGILRSVRVGAVIDAFARKVLSIGVVAAEPPAAFAVRLLREAMRTCGAPIWVVTAGTATPAPRRSGRVLSHTAPVPDA